QAIEEAACDLEQKGCFIVNTTTELVPGDPSLQSLLLDNQAQFEEFFWSYLKEGQERGEIASDKDVENIAHLLYTLYNGLRVVSKVKTDAPKLKRMIALSLQLLD
ncbi:MAG: TetR family transcriptional regulator C-terminal domain-containing protein, partial [Bacteroidota bacterium]